MSVIVALAGRKAGAVSGDSRRVESDGTVTDDFDKTFRLDKPPVIGAFLGLLEFDGRTIAQHVEDILSNVAANNSLRGTVKSVGEKLKDRLLAIPESEVGFRHRGTELLIVGESRIHSGEWEIHYIELRPDAANGEIILTCKKFVGYAHTGDTNARHHADQRLKKKVALFPRMTAEKLRVEARKAIETAISHCGQHPHHANIRACGGTPRTRTI